jgi:hypothetical protein
MGTWGTGLYSDDTACDVRDDYMVILGDGIGEPDATILLISKWNDVVSDPDVGPVFWLALADTQWKVGRLQSTVKEKALKVIGDGSDLDRWGSDQKMISQRKRVLSKLEERIKSPQPETKKIEMRYVSSTDWKIGEVYSFRLLSGNFILFHVIGFHEDRGGKGPVCGILDWIGPDIPMRRKIKGITYRNANEPHQHIHQFLLGSLGPKEFPEDRIEFVARGIKPKQPPGGYSVILWRNVDQLLEKFFGFV